MLLALASGVAGALSVAAGLSSALVMVAVALMPPAAAFGILLSLGDIEAALGALTLLGINVACVNLASKVVFVLKGVRPRGWRHSQESRRSILFAGLAWIVLLSSLSGIIIANRASLS